MNTTRMGTRAIVDRLGRLCRRAEALGDDIGDLKAALAVRCRGRGAFEGRLFRATVSTFDENRLDMHAVRLKLSQRFIRRHTVTREVTRVSVAPKRGRKDRA
jgi:hypothetical protein